MKCNKHNSKQHDCDAEQGSQAPEGTCDPPPQIERPTRTHLLKGVTKDQLKFLGTIGRKEYYLYRPDAKHKWRIVSRVPSTREAIRAGAGYKILTADYSQIEVRIAAELSGDPWLKAAINSGKDIHCYLASDVYGIPYDEFYAAWKDPTHPDHSTCSTLRSNIKGVTFGLLYGAGPKRVATVTRLSEEDAASLITRFFNKARVLKSWLEDQGALALAFGFTHTQRGRKRFYRLPTKQAETEAKTAEERKEAREARKEREAQICRQARNQPVQSSCVDILKPAMVKIYLALRGGSSTGERQYDAYFLFCLHDEIVMTAREDQAEAVAKIMKDCMLEAYNDVIKSVTHGPLDVTISDHWEKK